MGIIIDFAEQLSKIGSEKERQVRFEVHPLPGEVEVLKIVVESREELPIFLSVADTHIVCICYLWDEAEVVPEQKAEMMETMLAMNIPMPLSAFAKLDKHYVLFGSMARQSRIEEVVHEIEVLSENSLEVIRVMSDYLK